jgi:hypothetical protein
MRGMSLLCVLAFLCNTLSAQYVYTIKADSVKLTNCDSSELIIENHTQEPIRSSLAVNGPILAQKLTLSARDWPDYVFDSAYQLLSLPNLEKYIHQHDHLPGIPAASIVENNGTDVGETQAALLKKIEELTLYTIEQDKKLESQRQITEMLIREIRELKELVKSGYKK